MSLAGAEECDEVIWEMVSVSVATVALSTVVAVATFDRASTVSDWWSAVELK